MQKRKAADQLASQHGRSFFQNAGFAIPSRPPKPALPSQQRTITEPSASSSTLGNEATESVTPTSSAGAELTGSDEAMDGSSCADLPEAEAAEEAAEAKASEAAEKAAAAVRAAEQAESRVDYASAPPQGRMPAHGEPSSTGQAGALRVTATPYNDRRYEFSRAYNIYVSVAVLKGSGGRWEALTRQTTYTATSTDPEDCQTEALAEARRIAWSLLEQTWQHSEKKKRRRGQQLPAPAASDRSLRQKGPAQPSAKPTDGRASNGRKKGSSSQASAESSAGAALVAHSYGNPSVNSQLFVPLAETAPSMQLAMLQRTRDELRRVQLQLAQEKTAHEASKETITGLKLDLGQLQKWAISQMAVDMDQLPSPRQLDALLGQGYSATERLRTIYNHLDRAFNAIQTITGGDLRKTAELIAFASKKLDLNRDDHVDERKQRAVKGIIDSLRQFFVKARGITGGGRPPKKLSQAVQAIVTAIAHAPELGGSSLAAVASVLEMGGSGASKLSARGDAADAFISDGDYSILFEDRCKVRSDAYTDEQLDWVKTNVWLSDDFTRESEAKKDEIFDPKSRKANRAHHRLRWLEVPLMELYQRGRELYQEEAARREWKVTKMSSTTIRNLRPFWVKDPTRDVCLCRYHLEFDLLAKGFTRLCSAIKCPNDCDICENAPKLTTGLKLRAALTCPRPEGEERYDDRACVGGECQKCKELQLMANIVCPARRALMADHQLKWEKYEKTHIGQDKATGEDRYKNDFIEQASLASPQSPNAQRHPNV